jgi:hypothetical protein
MDGFKAYKYYMALKLHFTDPRFNVFVNRGRVRGTRDKFMARNDRMIFEKLARQFDSEKEYIQYIAASLMYGHSQVVYEPSDAMANYKEFLRRRQSITKIFTDDLAKIIDTGAQYNFSGQDVPDLLQLLMSKQITLETMVILNDLDAIVDKMKQNNQIVLLLGDELTRIEKSKGFIKYDSARIMSPYLSFLEDLKGNANG